MCNLRVHGKKCYHCTIEVPKKDYITAPIDGKIYTFCGTSCLSACNKARPRMKTSVPQLPTMA